jgi:hypothetical protein
MLPWLAAVVVHSVIAGVVGWNLKPSKPQPVGRFCCELQKDQQFDLKQTQLAQAYPDSGSGRVDSDFRV